jgi:hypothetical protein
MADDKERPNTHITDLKGRFRVETTNPSTPVAGDMYYNTSTNQLCYYTGSNWITAVFT